MLKVPQILVRAITLVGAAALLAACGQKGELLRPTEPAARQRLTLIQTLKPEWARSKDHTPARASAAAGATPTAVTTPDAATEPAQRTAPPTEADLVPQSAMSPYE